MGSFIRLPFPNLTKWLDEVNLFAIACPATKRISTQVGLQILHQNEICHNNNVCHSERISTALFRFFQNDNIVKINIKCQIERSRSLFITKQQLRPSQHFPSMLQSLSSYDKPVLQSQELSYRSQSHHKGHHKN